MAPAAQQRTEAAAPTAAGAGKVRRRHVLYLSGFDPQGPAHYHALYRDQAARQAGVAGYRIEVGPRVRLGANAAWSVQWQGAEGGAPVHTCYEFLRWDDLVRAHWPRGRARLIATTLATTGRLVANGSLWRILQTSWPACLALVAPALLMLGVVTAAAGLLGLVWGVHAELVNRLGMGSAAAVAVLMLALGGAALAHVARRAEGRVQMAWLMRSASVILRQARGELPALEQRLDRFADRLRELLGQAGLDEVLVVGHSSGAMLAASVVARALPDGPAPARLALLTLGECMPMLSYQPQALGFRAELARLRGMSGLLWVDYTAPPDACCFALVDPTEVCEDGLPACRRAPDAGPKRLSPRFAQLFDAADWRRIRRDKYRCHFQYLMAAERPGGYDYFLLTAADQRLGERLDGVAGVTDYRRYQTFGGPAR